MLSQHKLNMRYGDYLCVSLFFLLSFWVSQHMFISWDVSWHMEAARQIAENAQHGRNIFDDNPPMVFWFFIPIVWLHQISGISLVTLCLIGAHGLVVTSFLLCNVYLKEIYHDMAAWEIRIVRYAILIFLLFFSIPDYGQREMLLTAFCLPYIVLMAARMQTSLHLYFENAYFQAFLGFWMAIGIAMNPMFGAIVLALEVQLWVFQKKLVLLRPELITFFITFIVYLLLIAVFFPNYYFENIPSFFAFSPNANSNFLYMIQQAPSFLVPLSILLFLASEIKKSYRSWVLTLFICTVVSYIVFLLNKKIWYYHLFPSLFFSGILLITILCCQISAKKKNLLHAVVGFSAFVLLGLAIYVEYHFFELSYAEYKNHQATLPRLIAFFKKQPEDKTIFAFNTRLFPVFPLIDYVPLTFVSYEPCYWELPLVIAKNNNEKMTVWRSQWIRAYKKIFLMRAVKVMEIKKPDYVIVDVAKNKAYLNGVKFNYINYFEQNVTFRRLWKQYRLIETISHYAIYARSNGKPMTS